MNFLFLLPHNFFLFFIFNNNAANNFELDLREAIQVSPLSLSTPDLHNISHHNPFQQLKRSASSSELLYEKEIQRFYQAVQLDEEAQRNRTHNIDPKPNTKYVENKKETNSIPYTVEDPLVMNVYSGITTFLFLNSNSLFIICICFYFQFSLADNE